MNDFLDNFREALDNVFRRNEVPVSVTEYDDPDEMIRYYDEKTLAPEQLPSNIRSGANGDVDIRWLTDKRIYEKLMRAQREKALRIALPEENESARRGSIFVVPQHDRPSSENYLFTQS